MHVGKKFTTEIKSKCVNWLQAKKTNIFTCKANIFTCKANMLTYKTNIFRKVKVYDRNKEHVCKLANIFTGEGGPGTLPFIFCLQ